MVDAKEAAKNNENGDRKEALRAGVWVLIILAVVTFGEFLVAVIAPPWGVVLLLAAVFKAFFVVRDYMHFSRLVSGEEEVGE